MTKREFYTLMRLAINGESEGPDVVRLIEIIGVSEFLKRLHIFLNALIEKRDEIVNADI